MATKLARFIKQERIKQGLNYAELSRSMGYKNLNRGMRRIIDLEREGKVYSEILRKIISTLELDKDIVNKLISIDREAYEAEYERWLNEPVKMSYTIKVMPTIYLSYDLPSNITSEDEAVRFVAGIAKEQHNKCWVILSRKEKVYITEAGEVRGKIETKYGDEDYPYVRVR